MSKTYFTSKTLRLAKGTVTSNTCYYGQRTFHNFISMMKPNGSWSKPTLFKLVSGYSPVKTPRDQEVRLMRDIHQRVFTYNNDPVESFTVLKQNGPTTVLLDPRGFEIDVDTGNFIDLISKENCKVENALLHGPFIYAYSDPGPKYETATIRILKIDSDAYKNDLWSDEDIKSKTKELKKLDLEVGKVYNIYQGAHLNSTVYNRYVYLGMWKNVNIKFNYSTKTDSVWRILKNSQDTQYVRKAIENIENVISLPRHVFLMLKDSFNDFYCNYNPSTKTYVPDLSELYKLRFKYEMVDCADNPFLDAGKRIYSFANVNVLLLSGNNKLKIRELSDDQSIRINKKDNWAAACRFRHIEKILGKGGFDRDAYEYPVYTVDELRNALFWWIRKKFDSYFADPEWVELGSTPRVLDPESVADTKC